MWLRDSRRLLYTTGRELRLFDTVTRTSQVVFSSGREFVGAGALSPDERVIYTTITQPQGDIVLVNLAGTAQ